MISATATLTKIFDVVIIGGGLSGVMVAYELHNSNSLSSKSFTWHLLEARPVLGGRLVNDNQGNRIDLGGAWVWPDFQPNMKRLLTKRNMTTFLQPDDPSSTRIDGGAVELVHALSKSLPQQNIQLNSPVSRCSLVAMDHLLDQQCTSDTNKTNGTVVRLDTAEGPVFAKHVVLAVPPKLIYEHVHFDPALSSAKVEAMKASNTWMAGVSKVALVYDTKFWTEDISNMGLPRSQSGPAFQMYDASTKDGAVNAITFFTLVPSGSPAKTNDKVLGDQVASQVANVWNLYMGRGDLKEKVLGYKNIHVQHWPSEKYISEDPNPTQIHPLLVVCRDCIFCIGNVDPYASGSKCRALVQILLVVPH